MAHIYQGWVEIGAILIFAVVIEHIFLYFNKHRNFYFSYSSFSTAIGVVVLMYSPHLWIYFGVIALGLFQKHFITFNGKHFFNPSNFALIMVLLFFYKDAHIITGQFGDERWLALLVSFLAIVILVRVHRWIIPLAFILSYLFLQYCLVVLSDPVIIFEDIYHRLYSVTFVLFIYFMLTDPPVTPSKWYWQIAFAFLVSLMAVLLDRFYGFRVQHLFMAVFFFSLFTPLVEQWQKRTKGLMVVTFLLLLLAIMVIIFIESKPPFYFTMDA
ncbi:RnfABCDGE type electron transport complex subunit D [bacterium]|nr:RnfABCDGE type electron transport complex subunit D [bacterium]MBU1957546.1 RnfABCDGE type electron transport complex subunit D [bacterium]